MIFRGIIEFFEEDSICLMLMMMICIISLISLIVCTALIQTYSLLCLSIIALVFTEIYYHIEPRTKEDKKKGRDWVRVSYKKFDSFIDAILTTGILALIYEAARIITLDGLLRFAEILGIIVLSIIALIIYIWLNGLRDQPKIRSKKK